MERTTFLRNCWYIVALPEELTNRPLARRIAGEAIVCYRTAAGVPVALADQCCHRGVPLHLGTVVGDAIQCGYHGFTFDPTGACIRAPSQKSPPPGAKVRRYPLLERYGWTWIWMGTDTPDPASIPDFRENDTEGWVATRGLLPIQASYERAIDNILDLSHVSFVHRSTFGSDDALATLRFAEVAGGVLGERTGPPMPTPPLYQRLGFSAQIRQTKRMIYTAPCHVKAPIETFEPPQIALAGTERDTRSVTVCVLNSITPETATSCHYFWASARNFSLEDDSITALIREQTLQAFREDQLIIEAEQRSRDAGFAGGTAVRADVGGELARRVLARRIELEST